MTKARALHSLEKLAKAGFLPPVTDRLREVAEKYSVCVTPALLELIDRDDPGDPIAAQFIPSATELNMRPEERADPIGDDAHSRMEGLVHRYPDRVLLNLSYTCAAYCRFCFRRERVGRKGGLISSGSVKKAMAYIKEHSEIWEVILSGGDPLALSDRKLADIVARLNGIGHVKVLRIHTRLPVVNPSRITPGLVKALKGRCPVYILLHCNHARELTPQARAACARLIDAGFTMLSQSVLLRGVNDTAESLEKLMRAFVESRIVPHYLHHTDLARGTSHFRVPIAEGQALLRSLRGRVSGLCQPAYILDIPGGHGKVPIGPDYAENKGNGCWLVEDVHNKKHPYKDG